MSCVDFPCIACGDGETLPVGEGQLTRGVTSDCKPWPRCGDFVVCATCGHLQKRQDATWQADVARIYGEYEMYVLTGGNEQVIFDDGKPAPRTQKLLDCVRQKVKLPATGTMLDIGCGNGSLLRSFAGLYPGWQLAGFDLHDRFEGVVRSVPNVVGFYSGTLDNVAERFDVISLMYVIEHLPQPLQVLATLRKLLKPGGLLLVHTSNYWDNPFDLAVVDHCSHFVVDTLGATVARAGFDIIDSNDDWIAKELGVIGRATAAKTPSVLAPAVLEELRAGADQRLRWLGHVVNQSRGAAAAGLGVFGTAIAGTWLASMVPEAVRFFVDEDRQRTNKAHLGHPVLHPSDVPAHSPVYLAFPPPMAAKIQSRLRPHFPGLDLIVPPGYAAA